MLEALHIQNLATVSALEVSLASGLNVLSGETGAGKSVILGAIQNILGARAEKSLIRRGAKSCEVTGFFRFSDACPTLQAINNMLAEIGTPSCEEGQLILRRVITASGSRAYINSSPVALSALRQLGDLLVDIHGPNDHQSLLRPKCQLEILDCFGQLGSLREDCAEAYRQNIEADRKLQQLQTENLSPAEAELLRHQLQEIDTAALQPNEENELSERYRVSAHARRIMEIAGQCQRGLTESDGSITDQLSDYVRLLQEVADIDSERGGEFLERLETVSTQLSELAGDLEEFGESLDLDQQALAEIEERLDLIQRLKRKHGGEIQDVLDRAETLREKLAALDSREQRIAQAEKAVAEAQKKHSALCRELNNKRKTAAAKLAEGITAKLKGLGFEQSDFNISFAETEPGATGADRIEFCFAPNPGEDMLPLRKIASSGEIARVMLAAKTVLSAADQVPVLMFDEVDANIGGRIALSVAEELAGLGESHQVLCISHLPQIAARAKRHFEVGKNVQENRTITNISELDSEGRITELSRMMGATEDSEAARQHALEMLGRA
ncbi:MAG: DNA repair protein RecN [Lentisphaeria bacterium]